MKTKYILLLVAGLSFTNINAKDIKIKVSNNIELQRHELVELSINDIYRAMETQNGTSIIVKNAIGQQQDYQICNGGKLIFEANVRPHSSSYYTISEGTPQKMKTWTTGALYKIRKDDIAWENDRCAYRVYGPALQLSGEKAYGVDVWVKNTPDPIVADRYAIDHHGNIDGDTAKKEGNKTKADSIDLATSFHLDHGYGYDPYRVGATLGCGTPALINNGEIIYPYCYKEYKILDNGPLRFSVSLTYPLNGLGITEHRIISLDKGSNLNKMTVWYTGMKHPMDAIAGLVVHEEDTTDIKFGNGYIAYADPTDNMKGNNSEVYVGCVAKEKASFIPFKNRHDGATGHIVLRHNKLRNGEKFTYYFGAAWSKYDVRSFAEWQLRMSEFTQRTESPLRIEIIE